MILDLLLPLVVVIDCRVTGVYFDPVVQALPELLNVFSQIYLGTCHINSLQLLGLWGFVPFGVLMNNLELFIYTLALKQPFLGVGSRLQDVFGSLCDVKPLVIDGLCFTSW